MLKCLNYVVICLICITMLGCASGTYIVPDNKEFTTGGIFADKYGGGFFGGKNIKISGEFISVGVEILGNKEELGFMIRVPGGLRLIQVYADKKHAQTLYSLQRGQKITVYGTSTVISSTLRKYKDKGLVSKELSIRLDKLTYDNDSNTKNTDSLYGDKYLKPITESRDILADTQKEAVNAALVAARKTGWTPKTISVETGYIFAEYQFYIRSRKYALTLEINLPKTGKGKVVIVMRPPHGIIVASTTTITSMEKDVNSYLDALDDELKKK